MCVCSTVVVEVVREQRRPCETDDFNRLAAGLSAGNVVEIEAGYVARRMPVSTQSPDEK